ncbi:MAG TPA: hypothetical protein VEK06_02955 [Myxococcota bacterium]|nr:hypothetical protein [Myxococcota bacterium]
MKPLFSCALLFFLCSLSSIAAPVPPRAFLEYRLRSPAGNPLAVTLSVTLPADVCNDYDIAGEFLPVGEPGAMPDFPTFVGDVALIQTNRLCPGSPPVMVTVKNTFRFDPTPDGYDHLILLIPSEFKVMVTDILED